MSNRAKPVLLASAKRIARRAAGTSAKRLLYRDMLEAFSDSTGGKLMVLDGAGKIELVNRSAARMFGYGQAQLTGRNVSCLIPACAGLLRPDRVQKAMRATSGAGNAIRLAARHRDSHISQVEVVVRVVQLGHQSRSLCMFQASAEPDTTPALMSGPSANEAIDAIIVRDATGKIAFASEQACELLGLPRTAHEIDVHAMSASGRALLDLMDLNAVSLEQPLRFEYPVVHDSGDEAVAEIQLARLRLDGRDYCLQTVRYLTSKRQVEQGLDQLNRQVEQRVAHRTAELESARAAAEKKCHAKSEFLARMSHEIRTPMGAAISLTDLALAHASDARQRDYLTKIRAASSHLLGIVDDILDLAKIEAKQLRLHSADFDFMRLWEDLDSLSVAAATKGLALVFVIDTLLRRTVRADAGRIKQVLMNYISNAIKFTHVGRIAVHATLKPARDGAPHILFEISDTGIGLTREQVRRLFRAFHQAHPDEYHPGSSGLGLSISKQLVTLMGGRTGVRSSPGAGSTFWFTIPVQWGAAAAPAAETVNGKQSGELVRQLVHQRGAIQVLSVDDNEVNRQIVTELLGRCGVQTVAAPNGREALAVLAAQHIDCVLMDLQMPVMDGYTALAAIRGTPSLRGLPVIALTAQVFGHDASRGSTSGFNSLLTKPFSPHALYQHLYQALSTAAPGLTATPLADSLNHWSGGDLADGQRLRQLFSTVAKESMLAIHAAWVACSTDDIAAQIHKLLPSARMVDALEFARLCAQLDSQLVDTNWSRIGVTIKALERELARLDDILSGPLPQMSFGIRSSL